MAVEFDEETRRLLDGRNFATVATLDPDGRPHTSVVWIARDGDTVVFGTTAGRRKGRNLARDPRIGLTVFDNANPYRTVDIQGVAELSEDVDGSVQRALNQKYIGGPPPEEPDFVVRLVVRVTPHKITGFRGKSTHEA